MKMAGLTLKAALPILASKKNTIVLLSANQSLMVVIKNPNQRKILDSAEELYEKCEEQDYFSRDYWGESVRKTNKAELGRTLSKLMKKKHYTDEIKAAMVSVYNSIKRITNADFFLIS